ncbi:MAG: hypothetical protein RLY76_697 [Actinomycetota bacterium]
MKINFVTGLSDYALEDSIIEVLTQREFTFVARVLAKENLLEFLSSFNADERMLIILDECFALRFEERRELLLHSDQLCILEIDSETSLNSEEFLSRVFETLRKPEPMDTRSINGVNKTLKAKSDWIGFTGCNSAPGVTTIAINVAAEISLSKPATLVDADPERSDIAVKLGLNGNRVSSRKSSDGGDLITLHNKFNLLNLSNSENSLVDWFSAIEETSLTRKYSYFVDLGQAPNLSIAHSDRRLNGKKYIEALQFCSQLVYVINSEPHGLLELESFYAQTKNFYPDTKVTFVLNQSSNSSRHLAYKKSFKSKIQELGITQKHFIIPRDQALIDKVQSRFATVAEIGPRSTLRKSLAELSIYLENSR